MRKYIKDGKLIANKVLEIVYNRLSKMIYFVATTKEILVEGLVRLFKNNMWKIACNARKCDIR